MQLNHHKKSGSHQFLVSAGFCSRNRWLFGALHVDEAVVDLSHDNDDINIQAFLKYIDKSALRLWVQTSGQPQYSIFGPCVYMCML